MHRYILLKLYVLILFEFYVARDRRPFDRADYYSDEMIAVKDWLKKQ
jgi:hypothetical protein